MDTYGTQTPAYLRLVVNMLALGLACAVAACMQNVHGENTAKTTTQREAQAPDPAIGPHAATSHFGAEYANQERALKDKPTEPPVQGF